MSKRTRIGVLFGGETVEHGSSFLSGLSVLRELDPSRYQVTPIPIRPDGRWDVPASGLDGFDLVFPVLHGTFGEDGTVQGFLEMMGIPYVGAGVLHSALSMDKVAAKRLFAGLDLPVVPDVVVREGEELSAALEALPFGFPVFVKPAASGSSVGVHRAEDPAQLEQALEEARRYGSPVLLEPEIVGVELEVAALVTAQQRTISSVGSVSLSASPGGFYDFASKFQVGGSALQIPAQVPEAAQVQAREIVERLLRFGPSFRGIGRADLFWERDSERVFLSEFNTIPGLASASTAVRLLEDAGLSYGELLDHLIRDGLAMGPRRHALRKTIAAQMTKPDFIAFCLASERRFSGAWWLGMMARAVAWLRRRG